MIPIPAQISAGCGLAWKAEPESRSSCFLDAAFKGRGSRMRTARSWRCSDEWLCNPESTSARHARRSSREGLYDLSDNAATTLHKPPEVAEAVKQAILTAGNASQGAHGVSLAASRTVFETRKKLAQLFSLPAREDHVVFTMNSTGGAQRHNGLLSPGDHVSTDLEHNSSDRSMICKRGRFRRFVPADRLGNVRYEILREALFREGTKAIVCTHA